LNFRVELETMTRINTRCPAFLVPGRRCQYEIRVKFEPIIVSPGPRSSRLQGTSIMSSESRYDGLPCSCPTLRLMPSIFASGPAVPSRACPSVSTRKSESRAFNAQRLPAGANRPVPLAALARPCSGAPSRYDILIFPKTVRARSTSGMYGWCSRRCAITVWHHQLFFRVRIKRFKTSQRMAKNMDPMSYCHESLQWKLTALPWKQLSYSESSRTTASAAGPSESKPSSLLPQLFLLDISHQSYASYKGQICMMKTISKSLPFTTLSVHKQILVDNILKFQS
jgi:hypothetical protein